MIITESMMNEKVPLDKIPTRFDSAIDLYTYTKKGLILYNIKPDTWNVLYPFFGQENKFTIDTYDIANKDITYKELIDIYNKVYNEEYVLKKGFNETKRKEVLIEEFNKTFNLNKTSISAKLDSHYELKYSKTKNVYTLYYLESYLANEIKDINKLLDQNVYQQEFLNLETYPVVKEINGIKVVDSISILDNKNKFDLVKKNILD